MLSGQKDDNARCEIIATFTLSQILGREGPTVSTPPTQLSHNPPDHNACGVGEKERNGRISVLGREEFSPPPSNEHNFFPTLQSLAIMNFETSF